MNDREAPLVSIITPVLNRRDRIARAINSVAKQHYPHIEHIVVDGGSSDGTLDVLRSFESSLAFRWVTGPDEGMYDAINKGMELAHGDVVAYLNSDDLYFPWSVETAVRALHGDADMVYGDLAVLVERLSDFRFRLQYYPGFSPKYYTYVGALGQPTVFWKRAVTNRIGTFDPSYRLIGDCEYWLRAARAGFRLRHVREVQALQTDHGDTLRERHPETLEREWATLRAAYADWAGPDRVPWLHRVESSVSWHLNQAIFIAAAQRSAPVGWPRFLHWLSENDIEVPMSRLFWSALPGRMGQGHPLVDDQASSALRTVGEVSPPRS